jgi:hypothetical protein
MDRVTHAALISRGNLLKAGGGTLAAATVAPHLGTGTATAQTPERGRTHWGGRVTAAWLDR